MTHHHPHPGEILRDMVFEPLELSVSDATERLSMSRPALSRVLNGHAGISPDLAIRLEKAGVSTARFWMNLHTTAIATGLGFALRYRRPQYRRTAAIALLGDHR